MIGARGSGGGSSLDWLGTLPSWLTLIGAIVAIKAYRRDAKIRDEQAYERRLVEVERIHVAGYADPAQDQCLQLVNDSTRTFYHVYVELRPRDAPGGDAADATTTVLSFDFRRCVGGSRHDLRDGRLHVRTARQLDEMYEWTIYGTTADGYRVEIHSDTPPTAERAQPPVDDVVTG